MANSSDRRSRTDPQRVVSHKFPETTFSYTERDVALYALGIGACAVNPLDEKELQYVYHRDGQQSIKVFPTFGTYFVYKNEKDLTDVDSLQFDPSLLLHGQQYMEIYKPIPTRGRVRNKMAVVGLHDKGKAAIIELETTTYDEESGEALCMNRSSVFLRGAGGFSKPNELYSYSNYPANQVVPIKIPKGKPSIVHKDITGPPQALLYRLSGDYNPLHSDPEIASVAGFKMPILHGLCTYGFAVRAVIKHFCNGEPTRVRSIFGRFLLHVFPGETLITEMWHEGSRVIYQTRVKERAQPVLTGYVILNHIPSNL